MTSCKPTTLGELQLFKVLQRANLLAYYEAFISQGGDDVQQLCEAGEEEFLEIMALVGMACKPLHVRRLQKSLQEWVTRPAVFRTTNISYLPAQSISLTSLGIDTQELLPSVLNSSVNSVYNRSSSSAPPSQDLDVLDQSNHSISRSPQGPENISSQRNGSTRVLRMNSPSKDNVLNRDIEKGMGVLKLIEAAVQKLIKNPPTPSERKDVVLKLQSEGKCRSLVAALEGKDQTKLETEIQHFVKLHKNSDGTAMSRHELLLNEAAVKLCMVDRRFLLTKNELMSAAEKIASEVESKLSNKRRSSTHLHGSCSQTRLQEVNSRLRDIKGQRANLQKKLSDAKINKNVLRENECQSRLGRVAQEETSLLQERNELSNKLQSEGSEAPTAEKSFSAELADLAKAHNLSLGNFQSPSSTSSWSPQGTVQKIAASSSNGRLDDSESQMPLSDSPVYNNSSLSPPRMEETDFENEQAESEPNRPPSLIRVKMEDDEDDCAHGFPSRPNTAVVRGVKRKNSGCDDVNSSAKVTSIE